MNFRNIKIFFILLLLLINTYLLYNYFSFDKNSSRIDTETIQNVVSLLESNNIIISPQTIPSSYPDADIIESEFDSKYYENLTTAISLAERESINIMPDNSIRMIMRNGDLFNLNRRFGFEFISKSSHTQDSLIPDMISSQASSADASITKEEKKLIDSFVYPDTISEQHAPFSYEVGNIYTVDSRKIVFLFQTIDGIYIRDHSMCIELESSKVTRALGTWFFPKSSEEYSYDLYDQLSVLFEELDLKNTQADSESDNAGELISNKYTINEMSFSYCIYWSSAQDSLFFIPAWKIAADTGEVRYYNAVNCELYE